MATMFMLLVPANTRAKGSNPARLVVLIVVDQLGSDYLTRYGRYLKKGIDRLKRRGAFYANGVHRQSNTSTCPGHASIVTGAWPNVHGIVNNRWIDPKTGATIACTQDPKYGESPHLRMAPSLGDKLVENSQGKSKVVSISLKPRVAVITAAQKPTAAVWYDKVNGRFVSGRWNGEERSPQWVNEINQNRNPSLTLGQKWTRFRPKLNYEKIAAKDDRAYEYKVPGLGRQFPRTYGQGLQGPDVKWFGSYRGTPHALESTFALARAAVKNEGLGQDEHVDLLVVGITNLDLIGHWYGPHSQEALDTVLRIDDQIGKLMSHLEKKLTRDVGTDCRSWRDYHCRSQSWLRRSCKTRRHQSPEAKGQQSPGPLQKARQRTHHYDRN